MDSDSAVYLRFSHYYYRKLRQAETTFLLDRDSPEQGLALLDSELTQIIQAQSYIGNQLADQTDIDQTEVDNLCLAYAGVNHRILELRLSPTERLEWYTKALNAAERLNDLDSIRHACQRLGDTCRQTGSYDQGMFYYQRALDIAQATGNKLEQANIWMGIAAITAYRGDYVGSEKTFEQALALAREIGDPYSVGEVLNNLGNVYTGQNKIDLALKSFEEASRLFRDCQDLFKVSVSLSGVGMSYRLLGEYPMALQSLSESLLLARQLNVSRGIGIALAHLGLVLLNMEQTDLAVTHLKESAALLKMVGDRYTLVVVSAFLLHITLVADTLEESYAQLYDLLELSVKMRAVGNILAALVNVAKWNLLMGNAEACLELLELVDGRPEFDPGWLPYIATLSAELRRLYPDIARPRLG